MTDHTMPHEGMKAGKTDRPNNLRRAFSLIEVSMALLIVGMGLSALLGLFPAALRESGLALSDTSQAMFADQVLNMLHANASTVTNWNDWGQADFAPFLRDVEVPDADDNVVAIRIGNHTVANYLTRGKYMVYTLTFERPTANVVRAWMRVADRRHTDVARNPIYATEFVFMGM